MAVLYGLSGKQFTLESFSLNSGGEGEIFNIIGENGLIAKVYHQNLRTPELEGKLKYMVQKPPSASVLSQVAWPLDVLYDAGKRFSGFLMPRLRITTELMELYKYPPNKFRNVTLEQKLIIAENICAVISEVHRAGYVFGDFNPLNIGVDIHTGRVAFLDTDSYHIVLDKGRNQAYRCKVCLDGYVAPELLDKIDREKLTADAYALASLDTFTRETDSFSLAIHIFKLMMNGYTPFNGIKETDFASQANPGVGNMAIKRDNYCYKPGNKPQSPAVPPIETLPQDIIELFTRAFIYGRVDPKLRPIASQWHTALTNFEHSLKKCAVNPAHQYYNLLPSCPWCEADDRFRYITAPTIPQKSFAAPPVIPPSPGTAHSPGYAPRPGTAAGPAYHAPTASAAPARPTAPGYAPPPGSPGYAPPPGSPGYAPPQGSPHPQPVVAYPYPGTSRMAVNPSAPAPRKKSGLTAVIVILSLAAFYYIFKGVADGSLQNALSGRSYNQAAANVAVATTEQATYADTSTETQSASETSAANQDASTGTTSSGNGNSQATESASDGGGATTSASDGGGTTVSASDGGGTTASATESSAATAAPAPTAASFDTPTSPKGSAFSTPLNLSGSDIPAVSASYSDITGTINAEGDMFSYQYVAVRTGRYRFDYTDDKANQYAIMTIIDSTGQTLANTYGDSSTIDLTAGGTYQIQMSYRNGALNYAVRIWVPNELQETSLETTRISGSITYKGQLNNYTYTAPITGRYRFDLADDKANSYAVMSIWDATEATLANTYGDSASVDLAAGQKYSIQAAERNGALNYTISIGVPIETQNLPPDVTKISGSIAYAGQLNNYTYTAPMTGRYRFDLSDDKANSYVVLSIWDATDATLANSYGDSVTVDLAAGQKYSIRASERNGAVNYSISIGVPIDTQSLPSDVTVIKGRITYAGQLNKYVYTAPVTGKYLLALSDNNANSYATLMVWDATDAVLANSYGDSPTVELAAGKSYTIQVGERNGSLDYEIGISVQ